MVLLYGEIMQGHSMTWGKFMKLDKNLEVKHDFNV